HHRALLEDLGVHRHARALQRFDDPLHGLGIVAADAVVLDGGAADDVVQHLGPGTAIALDGDGEELRVRALRKAVRRLQIRLELLDLLQLSRVLRFRAVVVVEGITAKGNHACADEDGADIHGADATPTNGHGASASAAHSPAILNMFSTQSGAAVLASRASCCTRPTAAIGRTRWSRAASSTLRSARYRFRRRTISAFSARVCRYFSVARTSATTPGRRSWRASRRPLRCATARRGSCASIGCRCGNSSSAPCLASRAAGRPGPPASAPWRNGAAAFRDTRATSSSTWTRARTARPTAIASCGSSST